MCALLLFIMEQGEVAVYLFTKALGASYFINDMK